MCWKNNMKNCGKNYQETNKMPYIDEKYREDIDRGIAMPSTPGELNYAITKMIKRYIDMKVPTYKTYNEVIGVLECCKLELYRRPISKYEDKKIMENGDVY